MLKILSCGSVDRLNAWLDTKYKPAQETYHITPLFQWNNREQFLELVKKDVQKAGYEGLADVRTIIISSWWKKGGFCSCCY